MNEAAGLPAHNKRVRENMEHSLPYHADQPFQPSLFRNFAKSHPSHPSHFINVSEYGGAYAYSYRGIIII